MAKRTPKTAVSRRATKKRASKKTTAARTSARKTGTKKPANKKAAPRKRTTKKPVAKKTGTRKAGTKNTSSKRTAKKKTASRAATKKPRPVKTGRAPNPSELAANVVDMIKSQAGDNVIWKKHFSRSIVSIEGAGVEMAWSGIVALREKCKAWEDDHIVHAVEVDGPYVGATGFAIRYTLDTTTRSTGQRTTMTEVGVYTVRNGKVITEEFMYRV